jgi:dTMP kinase
LNPFPNTQPSVYSSSLVSALEKGTTIVCDRYAASGLAFSAVKPGLSYEWCRAPDISLPAPDLTIFLDVRPEVAKARGGYGLERYEKESVQRAVRDMFTRIGSESMLCSHGGGDNGNNPESSRCGNWCIIDAGNDVQHVAEEVWAAITAVGLNDGTFTPLGKLWESNLVV